MLPEHWLSWRCGLDRVTAREHLRIAKGLAELPITRDAFAQGRLSYSKVRAIVRVASADDEQGWVDTAIGLPAARLARLTGQYRTITRELEDEQTQQQSLSWRWDNDGMLASSGQRSNVNAHHDGALDEPRVANWENYCCDCCWEQACWEQEQRAGWCEAGRADRTVSGPVVATGQYGRR